MATNRSIPSRNAREATLRRRRSLAAVVAGASLMLGSGFAGLIPGLGSGATALTFLNGRAFLDINADGVQSGNADPLYNEVGIPNVTVTVTSSTGASATTTTNAIGDWSVTTELPGPFRVQYTNLPAKLSDGSNRGGSLQFNNGGNSIFGAFGKVDNLGNIVDITDVDLVGIGNRVWDDIDGNGIQDAGEPGIPNVVITISSPSGPLRTVGGCNGMTGDGVAETVTTDVNGLYQFVCLDTGKPFTLSIDKSQLGAAGPLAGYNATVIGAGGDITLDSNGQDAGSAIVTSGVTKGGFDMTYDFGFTKTWGGGGTTTTSAAPTTTTTAYWTTTTIPETTTTTVLEPTTTTVKWTTSTLPETTTTTATVPETTTSIAPVTTTAVPETTTTTKVHKSTTTTSVPATTTTLYCATTTTTTAPETTTTTKVHKSTTTTTAPATTTTKVYETTTTTVPASTTTTVPASTTTTTVPASTTTTTTTVPATTTTTIALIFVPVATSTTAPATTTTTPTTTTSTTSTTSTSTTVKPPNVFGTEITPLPTPSDTPAFTGLDASRRGFQGAGILLTGLGVAGLLRGRKQRDSN